ncbi:MAG: amino acid ABC transporter permease [Verrucomicrobia bacterium]|nr:amino acid ABC transporter permease [Verrucomicrobiota bacterium]
MSLLPALAAFDFGVFLRPSPESALNNLSYLVVGLGWSLLLALASWVVAFVIGSVVGVLRTLPGRILPLIGACYVEFFRNIPLLVQLFIWFFVIPDMTPILGDWFKQQVPPIWQEFIAGTACLGLFTAARIAEQIRAGIGSLGAGQLGAGLALGLKRRQVYLLVLLPVAYRILIPTLTSEFLNLIKNTAVASTIGYVELAQRSESMGETTSRVYEAFAAGTLLYALLNLLVMFLARALERFTALPGFLGGRK